MYGVPGVVAHAFNPSTREAEAGRFLSLRPAWSTERVPGQPRLYRKTLSQRKKKKKKKPTKKIMCGKCLLAIQTEGFLSSLLFIKLNKQQGLLTHCFLSNI
jgi:hypothetical protein